MCRFLDLNGTRGQVKKVAWQDSVLRSWPPNVEHSDLLTSRIYWMARDKRKAERHDETHGISVKSMEAGDEKWHGNAHFDSSKMNNHFLSFLKFARLSPG